MELPCQKVIKRISKLSIVTKYTLIFGSLTFIIFILISYTLFYHTRENFEFSFISRVHCFTNSLKFSLVRLNEILNDNKKFYIESDKFIKDQKKRGNIIYKFTVIKSESRCAHVSNNVHMISIFPSQLKYYKTCFNIGGYSFYNYFSPEFYSKKLYELRNRIILIFIGGFFIFISLIYIIFKKLLSPIVCLSNDMKNIQFGKKCDISSLNINENFEETKDEISNLIRSYCAMLNKLNQLQEEQINMLKILHESEKYATIGKLVAGLAHEINNAIGGIKNSLYNLRKREISNDEKAKKYILLIEKSSDLLTDLMQRLLNFSRPHQKKFSKINLKNVILEATEFLKNKIKDNNIKIEIDVPENLLIYSDKYSLIQIFLNLLINSIDALKEKSENHKFIKISCSENKNSIEIEFFDNGPGIPNENLEKIFEPFFTTKSQGNGYGLGLFIVKGLISSLNYGIEIDSELKKWTRVKILIPKKE